MAVPNMTLKTVNFTPLVNFTPIQYKSSRPDSTLLSKSLQTQEARAIEARNNKTAITESFSKLRPQLDKSELAWLDAEEDRINNELRTQIDLGNTESAIRMAQEEADALAGNKSLQYKVLANQQRQEWLKGINSQNRSALSKRYIEALNPYYDDGTGTWKPQFAPEYEIELNKLQQLAAAFTAGESGGSSGSREVNTWVDPKTGQIIDTKDMAPDKLASLILTGDANLLSSENIGGGSSYSRKSAESMEQTFRDILNEPKFRQALTYTFNSTVWGLEEAKKLLDDPNLTEAQRMQAESDYNELSRALKNKNGIEYRKDQYDEWLENNVISMFKNMEYDNRQTSSSQSITYGGGKLGTQGINSGDYTDITENTGGEDIGVTGYTVSKVSKHVQNSVAASEFNRFF